MKAVVLPIQKFELGWTVAEKRSRLLLESAEAEALARVCFKCTAQAVFKEEYL